MKEKDLRKDKEILYPNFKDERAKAVAWSKVYDILLAGFNGDTEKLEIWLADPNPLFSDDTPAWAWHFHPKRVYRYALSLIQSERTP